MAQEERSQKDERLPYLYIRFEVAQYARVLTVGDSEDVYDKPIIDLNSYFFDYIHRRYYGQLLEYIEWFEQGGKDEIVCTDKDNMIMIWEDYSPGQQWGDSFIIDCKDKESFGRFLEAIKDYIRRMS